MPRRKNVQPLTKEKSKQTVAIYCRVSTQEQGDSGLSLSHQEKRCNNFCIAKDWDIYKSYIEVASAGKLNRPELNSLLNDASDSKFDIVVALRLDRVSRVPRDFYNLAESLDKYNISISTVDNDVDTTTVQGRMLLGVLLQFAAFEREINSERTRAAIHQKALKGEHRGGMPVLGYDLKDKKLILNKDEAEIVKTIFHEYINGTKPSEIAQKLNSEGEKTKFHITKKGKEVGGEAFTRNHIHNVITNPVYTGQIDVKGDLFPGIHDQIISKEDFKKADDKVTVNAKAKNLGQPKKGQLLLNGIIKCGQCGSYMTTRSATGRSKTYHYYACTKQIHKGASACTSIQPKAEDMESVVIDIIKKMAQEPKYLEDTLATLSQDSQGEITIFQKKLDEISLKKSKLKKSQKKMTELLIEKDLGEIDSVVNKIKEINNEVKEIETKEIEIKKEIDLLKTNIVDPIALQKIYSDFTLLWDELVLTEKREVIKLLVKNIEVNIEKKADKGKIKIALWDILPKGKISDYKIGSSFCSVSL
ncbi:MAG: recombinase family protein, partial [Calditrichaeota bacterium]|nr:recombinase family protein [Calditrichota bacterium]NOG47995.1 recombinase family protein [Calditrichota bacterium]